MIVGLPRGTAIDGQDLTGWATDMFMSGKNQKQKNEGRAVNLRFRPGTPVELFTGRGAERRTVQVDPQTLVQAIIDAQKRSRDAEETRRDDPERRHTDLKSTLDRFHTKLRENLDGLNTATPAPGIDRNHGQRKTL